MKRQLTAAVLACAFALLVAPPANQYDPQTNQYLAQLRAAGIGYASPDTTIELGKLICDSFRKQTPYQRMTDTLMRQTNLSAGQAQTVIANATTYLCPEVVIPPSTQS
jgi:hypothetical protein